MIVTNHRTGETCTLSFKPRGWRAKDSAEVKGVVTNAQGHVEWDIAGRESSFFPNTLCIRLDADNPSELSPIISGWTSQLVARKSGAGHGSLGADDDLPRKETPEYILLWRNTPKPPAPFNLSPFAVTLNDVPVGLKELLPPTDCRLRPDQRAFENADVSRPVSLSLSGPNLQADPSYVLHLQYDRANDLKNAQEAKQRETRKKREQGALPPHEPRWFTRSTDPDTKDQVWEPRRSAKGEIEYWAERSRAGKEGGGWKGVQCIFVDEEGN